MSTTTMRRSRTRDAIHGYFEYNYKTNKSICQVQSVTETGLKTCLRQITGKKSSNLKKHVQTNHRETFAVFKGCADILQEEIVLELPESPKKPYEIEVEDNKEPVPEKRARIQRKCKVDDAESKNVSVSIDPDNVIDGIIEMVTVNGRPFTCLSDSGFLKIVSPIFEALSIHPNRHNVVGYLHARYETLLSKLHKLVENRLINLKIDCVTRKNRSFMGLNLQFLHNEKIVVFSLSATEVSDQHGANNLEQLIIDELNKCGISISQIYSITTNNGTNILNDDEKVVGKTEIKIEELEEGFENNSLYDENLIEDVNSNNLCENILSCPWDDKSIISVRCPISMLDLSVQDTLKSGNEKMIAYNDALLEARQLVKELRTENITNLTKHKNLRKPVLDCSARWSSVYDMLSCLTHDYKTFCEEFKLDHDKLDLHQYTWILLDEITQCLAVCVKAAKKLQDADLTLMDVYRIICICEMDVEELGSPFSANFITNLTKRKEVFFQNDTFLACMFLDPRFSFELTDVEKEKAINHLVEVFNRCCSLRDQDQEEESGNSDVLTFSQLVSCTLLEDEDESESRYEKVLAEKRKSLKAVASGSLSSKFEAICRSFRHPALKARDNVLSFWEQKKMLYPELYLVSQVLFSVPATQATLPNLLGQLQVILDPFRTKLKSDSINDILVLKSNMRTFDKICLPP